MNSIASGTVLITGPTGGLGKAATLAIANRPARQRPDLLLVGRTGQALIEVADEARAAGATVHEIGCDLARLADVLTQVWDDGYGHGRDDEANGQPYKALDEERIRDAMTEATDNPGRIVTR